MSPPLRKCICTGCAIMVHQNQIMCKPHRKLVSAENLAAVAATWRAGNNARTDEEKWEAARLHKFACDRARYDVEDALKKRKAA